MLVPDIQKIVMWPNIDAGSDHVSKGIRVFRENNPDAPIFYYKNFTPEDYAKVINNAACCIGNSSSFIREGSFLGVPAVVVGDRQSGREHGNNVVFSNYDRNEIAEKIKYQISSGRYESERRFGNGNAGQLIAEHIAKADLA